MIFTCPQCHKDFEEPDGVEMPECCVGGHWTPHNSDDKPTGRFPASCCHQFQKEIKPDSSSG